MKSYTLIIKYPNNVTEQIITYNTWADVLSRLNLLIEHLLKNAVLSKGITFKQLVYDYLNFDRDQIQLQLGNYMLMFLRPELIDKASDYILDASLQRWKKMNCE